ncbi:MAG: site-specific DNA-methyltransferase [Bacteroidales bacterium]|jgi:DNA modification methylase|nr:site-specific DNA-methyltransferase [Bacteroidales bacterium]
MEQYIQYIHFDNVPVNPDWCFKNVRSTEQWTHGYHRYPAKFLPNLVKKLIEEYTQEDDLVADMFAGCGTTLVEAKIHGRKSVGVDINPVAELITRAKINPINPEKLTKRYNKIIKRLDQFSQTDYMNLSVHEKIDYWFFPEHKAKIAFLYNEITSIKNTKEKEFFLVSLSHILKNCSKWLQSSTKPQIDPKKKPSDPFDAFQLHSRQMMNKNSDFYSQLVTNDFLNVRCDIKLEDARKTSIKSNSVAAIVTSPPYVTSYEYADIHQLTGYWYEYIENLADFRRNFIGTFYSLNQNLECESRLAQDIVSQLLKKDPRTAKEVANYFKDMSDVGKEMHRILRKGGHACLVIGNTTFKNIKIKSAEVIADLLILLGFEIVEVIKRSIPNKLIPTIRDEVTGKFSKLENANSKLVYPEEYILIVKKI